MTPMYDKYKHKIQNQIIFIPNEKYSAKTTLVLDFEKI